MVDIIQAIDALFVVGSFIMLVATVATLFGGKQARDSGRFSSDGDGWIAVGSFLTLVAMVPFTIYAVTRAFPADIFQQVVVGVIVMGVFIGVESLRTAIQFGIAIIVGLAFDIAVVYPLKALSFAYRTTIGRLT